jgi:hypothetical protein
MTMRAALTSQYPFAEKMPAEQWSELRQVERPFEQYKLFVGHFRYFFRDVFPGDAKVFTILRDPVERTISHLKHMLTDPGFHELHELAKGRDLRAIAQDPRIISQCSEIMAGYLSKARQDDWPASLDFDAPESAYTKKPDDISAALAALDAMDFVGFVDDLSADFARISAMLGLHPPVDLPVINSASERGRVVQADAELAEIVREANPMDCAFYAEALRKRGTRAPVASRRDRIEALLRGGVYAPIDGPMDFPMSGPIPGVGFWSQETDGKAIYRWTGPENDLVFELPIKPGRRYSLEIVTRMRRDVGALSAFVNDSPVEIERTKLEGFGVRLAIPIDVAPALNFTTVRLHSELVLPASETDRRKLGFVMVSATLRSV